MTTGSFRLRLAVRFTALMAATFLIAGLAAVTTLRRVLTAQFDGTLLRLAAIEASAVSDSPDSAVHFHEGVFSAQSRESLIELARYAEIWRADGTPLVRSQSLGLRDLPGSLDAFAAARNGEVVEVTLNWEGTAIRSVYYPLALVRPVQKGHILQIAAPLQPVSDVLATFVRFLLGLGFVATALTFVGGWALATHAVRPAREIAEQAEAITAGSLGARIRARVTATEYERLVAVLNGMLGRIEAAFEGQRRFVADASHEIRHPLTVLRAALDLALRRDRSVPEYRAAIQDAIDQADRVSALAEGLLTLARADAGVLNPHREPHDLGVVVMAASQRMELVARNRNVHLKARVEPVTVSLDSALVGRALDNLIDNALRFTPVGSTVSLAVELRQGTACVHVADVGPGVSHEQQPQLFERFFRGDLSRGAEGGAGLGLAIAKGIAAAHGGTVTYSPNLPTGSVFTLCLPL